MLGKRTILKILSITLLVGIFSGCKKTKKNSEFSGNDLVITNSISINSGDNTFICNYQGNDYQFHYEGLVVREDSLNFSSNGYFENVTPMDGLEHINLSGLGKYQISYGYEQSAYEFVSKQFENTHNYVFNNDHPSFFKVAFSSESSVASFEIKFSSNKQENPFKKIPSLGEVPMKGHTYRTKETVDYPSFPVSEGLSYHLSDDGTYYIVDNYFDNLVVDDAHRIVFPSTYNDLPVKRIGFHGFLEREWIREIYIPESITMIENECFSMCGLKKVYWDAINCDDFPARNGIFHPISSQNIDLIIGPHVKHIPARMMLPSLMTPNIHANVNSISFAHNSVVESIGEYAFYGQSSLTRIDIPSTVKTIGDYAFYGWGLDELKLENIESIGNSAFRFNGYLENVSLPNCLTTIGESTFEGCEKLKELNLENTSIEDIPFAAFKNCASLEHIRFPKQLLTIGESAFENCETLQEVVLPSSNKEINNRAFYNCSSANFLELNRDLKAIKNEAFYGCSHLSNLVIKSKAVDDLKLNNKAFVESGQNGLSVFVAPEVERLPANLFYGTSLTSRLPIITNIYFYKVASVGENAFFGQENTDVVYYGFNSEISSFQIGQNNDILNNMKAREE